MNAFIIGNGFDIAHGMHTAYKYFYEYLKKRFPKMNCEYMYVPTQVTAPDGGDIVDESDATSLLCYLINNATGENWNDFEKALGDIDLLECFDDIEEEFDRDGERNYFREACNNEDRISDLRLIIPMIKTLFSDWVNTLSVSKTPIMEFKNMIDKDNDLFISFNYTPTLEILYGCKNVIHMHGKIGEEIIVGHNGDRDYSEEKVKILCCFNDLSQIYEGLRKDTESVIERHYKELTEISSCKHIYSYGFSYSDPDIPYIKTICELIKGNHVKWFLNDYDEDFRIEEFKSRIIENGFDGEFGLFH